MKPLTAWLRRRLTAGEVLGLEFTLGVLVFVAAAWLFGGIAEDVVSHEPLTRFDRYVAEWFAAHQNPAVTAFMLGVSEAHTWPYVAGAALALVIGFAYRRQSGWIAFTLIAMAGGMAINTVAKLVVHRARPTLSGLSAALHTYSFPSGHTAAATLLWGIAAFYLAVHLRRWGWRVLALTGAVLLVALVAQSRVYLGVHYVSDVLAAMVEETAWLALSFTAVDTYWRQRNGSGLT